MSAVKLVFEFDSMEAAQIFLSAHVKTIPVPVAAPAAAPAPAKKEAKITKPAAQPVAPAKNGPVVTAPAAVTYDHVKAAAMKLANKKGRDALVKVLTGLGLSNAQDAKPDQYKQLIEACEAEAVDL